jgi:hypothetical protein
MINKAVLAAVMGMAAQQEVDAWARVAGLLPNKRKQTSTKKSKAKKVKRNMAKLSKRKNR